MCPFVTANVLNDCVLWAMMCTSCVPRVAWLSVNVWAWAHVCGMCVSLCASQYLLFRDWIRPRMDRDLKRQQDADEHVWSVKEEQRRKLGIGPPLRPTKENAWRLEQIYDDD